MSILKAKNKLIKAIANREGKKHQASVGDIREILKIIVDLESEGVDFGGDEYPECCAIEVIEMMSEEKQEKSK